MSSAPVPHGTHLFAVRRAFPSVLPAPAMIKQAAVLGAGTMGSRIAAHLANAGLPVLLLDLAGDAGKRPAAIAEGARRPQEEQARRLLRPGRHPAIRTGNFDDDLALLAECDWVIEAVTENLAIKQHLLAKIAPYLKPDAILTTNTSGLPVASIASALPAGACAAAGSAPTSSIRRATCGWWKSFHARYRSGGHGRPRPFRRPAPRQRSGLRARHAELHRQPHRRLHHAGSRAADAGRRPDHRGGGRAHRHRHRLAAHRHLPAGGHGGDRRPGPRGARTSPQSRAGEARSSRRFVETMLERRWLGDKTSQGFYKKEKDAEGKETPPRAGLEDARIPAGVAAKLPSLEMAKNAESLPERLRSSWPATRKDKAARFHWRLLSAPVELRGRLPAGDRRRRRQRRSRHARRLQLGAGPVRAVGCGGCAAHRGAHAAAGEPVSPCRDAAGGGAATWYRDDGGKRFDPASGTTGPLPQPAGIARIADFRAATASSRQSRRLAGGSGRRRRLPWNCTPRRTRSARTSSG